MACAAITSNRSTLFLFVKIHIFSFSRCTHRGMGHEPLVKVSWPLSVCPPDSYRDWPRFALVAGLVRKVGSARGLACGICWGFWVGQCVGIGLWPCGRPFFVRQAVFRFWPWAVFRTGFAGAGALACGRSYCPDKPVRWRKTKHPTFGAFTKPKNLFQPFVRP